MSNMKLIILLCLVALWSSQQVDCDESTLNDETQVSGQLEGLPNEADLFDFNQLKSVIMDLMANIRSSWRQNKSKIEDTRNKLKMVVHEELKKIITDLKLRQERRELVEQMRAKMGLPEAEQQGGQWWLAERVEDFKKNHARITDQNGVERPFHEQLFLSADGAELESELRRKIVDPFAELSEDETRELMRNSFIGYSQFVEHHNEKLKRERIESIKRKTQSFFGDIFKEQTKDLAYLLVQEVLASRKIDLKSGTMRAVLEKALKHIAWYICDVLTDLLALTFGRELMPEVTSDETADKSYAH